tara:strand:- start:3285 stop:3914 length:630 start_codon:yes stop_codon:yes gene_type:complete
LIVIGLSSSRQETKKIFSFLNKEDYSKIKFESDLKKISWKDSENIAIRRIKTLEKSLYENVSNSKNQFKMTGEVGFYFLPYVELLIKNFPYLKFVCTNKNKKKIYYDILEEIKTSDNIILRHLLLKKKYKNYFINHDGSKWEKDFVLDKCYPKFKMESLEKGIEKYIDTYYSSLKFLQRKYPKNLKLFYSDELKSEYGKKKIFKFLGVK